MDLDVKSCAAACDRFHLHLDETFTARERARVRRRATEPPPIELSTLETSHRDVTVSLPTERPRIRTSRR